MVGLLHAMAFMVLLLIGWVIWNNKPLPFMSLHTKTWWKRSCMKAREIVKDSVILFLLKRWIGHWRTTWSKSLFFCANTHQQQRSPYLICTGRSGNVRHWCRGGWAGPRLFLGGSFQGRVYPLSGIKVRSLVGLSAHSAFH